jgi:hypothetical protein
MRRSHAILALVTITNVLCFQNCGPSPIHSTNIYQGQQGSLGAPGESGTGVKMLSYESDSGTPLPGTDAIDKRLTWYSNGEVIETVIRHAASGDVSQDTALAVISLDTVTLRGRIQALPNATTYTMVTGSSVPCGSGTKRSVAFKRDGSAVVLQEERDCSGVFNSDAFDSNLFNKITAIRDLVK